MCLVATCVASAQDDGIAKSTDKEIANAQTISYCEVIDHPEKFNNKMIRVRVLYKTDFEKSEITSTSCDLHIPISWVTFEPQWEHRTKRQVRHAISNTSWRNPMEIVVVGVFKSDGPYGHMGMYQFLFEVYKVESVKNVNTAGLEP
jgi:hypothetical protein